MKHSLGSHGQVMWWGAGRASAGDLLFEDGAVDGVEGQQLVLVEHLALCGVSGVEGGFHGIADEFKADGALFDVVVGEGLVGEGETDFVGFADALADGQGPRPSVPDANGEGVLSEVH